VGLDGNLYHWNPSGPDWDLYAHLPAGFGPSSKVGGWQNGLFVMSPTGALEFLDNG
jgi:hypothetical protein